MTEFAVLRIDELRLGMSVDCIDRVLRAVEHTPLPRAPEIVLGIINVRGRVVPLVDLRKRFRLPAREIEPADCFVLARTARRSLAVVADAVEGLISCTDSELVPAERLLAGLDYVEGVVKREDGLILVHDLDRFLSLDESHALERALETGEAR